MSSHDRSIYLRYAEALKHPNEFSGAVAEIFSIKTNINVVHPFNELQGASAYLDTFLRRLQHAFEGLCRCDEIFMAGEFEGQNWIGIKAAGTVSYL